MATLAEQSMEQREREIEQDFRTVRCPECGGSADLTLTYLRGSVWCEADGWVIGGPGSPQRTRVRVRR